MSKGSLWNPVPYSSHLLTYDALVSRVARLEAIVVALTEKLELLGIRETGGSNEPFVPTGLRASTQYLWSERMHICQGSGGTISESLPQIDPVSLSYKGLGRNHD